MLKASYGLVIGKDIYNGKELIIKNKLNQIFFIPFYSKTTAKLHYLSSQLLTFIKIFFKKNSQ